MTWIKAMVAALELARVIAGETPGCPVEAKLAVGHVHSRNMVWYGDADPKPVDLIVALTWQNWPDPTAGAQYLLGPHDAAKLAGHLGARSARWQCPGTFVEAYQDKR